MEMTNILIKKYTSFLKKLYFIKKDIENDSLGLGLSMVVLEYFIDLKNYIYYLIVKFGLHIVLNEIRLKIPFYYFSVDIEKEIFLYEYVYLLNRKIVLSFINGQTVKKYIHGKGLCYVRAKINSGKYYSIAPFYPKSKSKQRMS